MRRAREFRPGNGKEPTSGQRPQAQRAFGEGPRGPDVAFVLNREAELHELAAERYFVLGDAEHGESERQVAMSYRQAARRHEAQGSDA